MKINVIKWPTCPHCNTLIDDWRKIPAHLVMGSTFPDFGVTIDCPICNKKIDVYSRITVEINALKALGSE